MFRRDMMKSGSYENNEVEDDKIWNEDFSGPKFQLGRVILRGDGSELANKLE